MADRLLIALIVMAAGVGLYRLFQRWQQARASSAFEPTGKPTVLYFRSDTCAPCLTQARFLEQVRRQFGDRVAIEKIDADVERGRADRFGVFTVPTTLVMDAEGKVRHANYGLVEPAKLAAQLAEV
jgi:thiol-disulfide isomerase/thioredoxin